MNSNQSQQHDGLEALRNLGPRSQDFLHAVGIQSREDLETLGPVVAYHLVKQKQSSVTLNLLWSLAAGLQQKDWKELTAAEKSRLLEQYQSLQTDCL